MANMGFGRIGVVVILALAGMALAQAPPGDAEISRLVALLKSKTSSDHEKIVACQRLAVIGDARAVPPLAAMLGHQTLGHAARIALETNPDPAAGAALRAALGSVKGEPLVGVIGSVGRRRDRAAVGALVKCVRGTDPAAGAAAALALGRIGDEQAIAAIERCLPAAPQALKAALLEGYLIAADQALADGQSEQAARMFQQLRQHDGAPQAVRLAALRGTILAQGHPAGSKLAVEALKGDDPHAFDVALRILHEVNAAELPAAYAAELATLKPERRARLIEALAGRGGPDVLAALMAAAEAGEANVRVAAIRALAHLGDPAGLPLLLKAVTTDETAVASAARAGLVVFPGDEADAAVLAMLASTDPAGRRIALDILSKRPVPGAAQALLNAARDRDEQTRTAAIRTLGDVASPGDAPAVIALLLAARSPTEIEVAERALAAIVGRAESREAMAEPLIAAMADAGAAGRCALLRILPTAGGPKALEAVRSATKAFDKQVQDAAIRALCNWPTADAAADVLAVAKEGENAVHKRLALRAYVRLIGEKHLTPEQRAAMCREAAALAQTAEEKKLVLGALATVPSKETLAVVLAWMPDAAVSDEAVAAILAIAQKLTATEPDAVKAALTQAAAATKNEELLRRLNAQLGRTGDNNR